MNTANQKKNTKDQEMENLRLHRQMYERRVRLLKERGGLTEKDAADQANDPYLFDVENTETSETE
jgi:hypothetical protein